MFRVITFKLLCPICVAVSVCNEMDHGDIADMRKGLKRSEHEMRHYTLEFPLDASAQCD